MKNGVLIDRELLENMQNYFKEIETFQLTADLIQQAIENAPQAVIPIQKAHDCSLCKCCACMDGVEIVCVPEYENGSIEKYIEAETAPDWCPQICKE